MSELESSGLLEREAAPSLDADATADPQLAATSEPNLAAAIVDAVNDDTAAVPQQQDLSDLPEQAAAVLANADAAPSEPAEQRVLGDLEGAPTWREVLPLFLPLCIFSDMKKKQAAWDVPCNLLCAAQPVLVNAWNHMQSTDMPLTTLMKRSLACDGLYAV